MTVAVVDPNHLNPGALNMSTIDKYAFEQVNTVQPLNVAWLAQQCQFNVIINAFDGIK